MPNRPLELPSLSANQKSALEEIFRRGWSVAEWPFFGIVDRPLYDQGIDSQLVVQSLVPEYVRIDGLTSRITPDVKLRLTVRGVNEVQGRDSVIPQFLEVLRYLVAVERSHIATNDYMEPIVTQEQVAQLLSRNRPLEMARRMASGLGLLLREEDQIYNGFSRSAKSGEWSLALSDEIRRFQGVSNINEFLERASTHSPIPTVPTDSTGNQELIPTELPTIEPRSVFVVHGRDLAAKKAVIEFLEALGLHAILWDEPVGATGSGTPFTGHVVANAFKLAHAVIVLLTPDDMAQLHPDLLEVRDQEWERRLTGQARPNVLFEAGMAFATHPDRTIVVEIGFTRPFSDIAGRNTVQLSGNLESLQSFAHRLESSGCPVDRTAGDWTNPSRFDGLQAQMRSASPPNGTMQQAAFDLADNKRAQTATDGELKFASTTVKPGPLDAPTATTGAKTKGIRYRNWIYLSLTIPMVFFAIYKVAASGEFAHQTNKAKTLQHESPPISATSHPTNTAKRNIALANVSPPTKLPSPLPTKLRRVESAPTILNSSNPHAASQKTFYINGFFIDRNGNPIPVQYSLSQTKRGKTRVVTVGYNYDSKGMNMSGAFKTVALARGKYSMQVEDTEDAFSLMLRTTQEVTISESNLKLGKIELPWSHIRGTFVDRKGNPVPVDFHLVDAKGNLYGGRYYEFSDGSFQTSPVIDGKYTIRVQVIDNYFGEVKATDEEIQVSGGDLNLGKVVLPWSRITGSILDRNGQPVRSEYWLTDNLQTMHGSQNDQNLPNGSFKSVAVSDGVYKLHIKATGYIPVEETVVVSGNDLSVGNVVLSPSI